MPIDVGGRPLGPRVARASAGSPVLTPADKVRLLREATRGASDCYALRAQPSWRPVYSALPDEIVLMHLSGEVEIGAYPLIPNGSELPRVWWIAADFDGKRPGCNWESDVQRFMEYLVETGANILINRSRSGLGTHVRVLFAEPVPAWMARRWMTGWLEESGVVSEFDEEVPTSFDRLIPPQDTLLSGLTRDGYRRPGNLIGSPMHAGLARACGGTLPIAPEAAVQGDFAPDGKHWEHLIRALDGRAWGEAELARALADSPGKPDLVPPAAAPSHPPVRHHLPVVDSDDAIYFNRRWCEFFVMMEKNGHQSYNMWLALVSQLHRFGAAGRQAFHDISAVDHRYDSKETDRMWDTTQNLPMRCDRIADRGWRCPHLGTRRCAGAVAPTYLFEHARYEPK